MPDIKIKINDNQSFDGEGSDKKKNGFDGYSDFFSAKKGGNDGTFDVDIEADLTRIGDKVRASLNVARQKAREAEDFRKKASDENADMNEIYDMVRESVSLARKQVREAEDLAQRTVDKVRVHITKTFDDVDYDDFREENYADYTPDFDFDEFYKQKRAGSKTNFDYGKFSGEKWDDFCPDDATFNRIKFDCTEQNYGAMSEKQRVNAIFRKAFGK